MPTRRQFIYAATSLATGIGLATSQAAPLAARPPAPELAGIQGWLGSPPLTLAAQRGKVVLLEFWALGCSNCIHTLPQVVKWHRELSTRGLLVLGVHTPEFPYEGKRDNIEAAMKRHGITYPVAMDNDYQTWKAYSNQYWPALYAIDKQGRLAYTHFGEGRYAETEQVLLTLLSEAAPV